MERWLSPVSILALTDGYLSVAALMAQGLCFLVLSEMYSCPNEEQTSVLFYPLTTFTQYYKGMGKSLRNTVAETINTFSL